MFGPNTHLTAQLTTSFSHRDPAASGVLSAVTAGLARMIPGRPTDTILIIPGTGTTGMEAVLRSLRHMISFPEAGKFHARWQELSRTSGSRGRMLKGMCHFETSLSVMRMGAQNADVLDCVSSFPYYKASAPVMVGCFNKQLGCLPGCAWVSVSQEAWEWFVPSSTPSTLNLWLYKKYMEDKKQLPFTAPTALLHHYALALDSFCEHTLRRRCDIVCGLLSAYFTDAIIGDTSGPVITVPSALIPEAVAKAYDIYGWESGTSQFFTYNANPSEIEHFLNLCRKARLTA